MAGPSAAGDEISSILEAHGAQGQGICSGPTDTEHGREGARDT